MAACEVNCCIVFLNSSLAMMLIASLNMMHLSIDNEIPQVCQAKLLHHDIFSNFILLRIDGQFPKFPLATCLRVRLYHKTSKKLPMPLKSMVIDFTGGRQG